MWNSTKQTQIMVERAVEEAREIKNMAGEGLETGEGEEDAVKTQVSVAKEVKWAAENGGIVTHGLSFNL